MRPDKSRSLQKRWEFPGELILASYLELLLLHGDQFNFDVFCLVPEVEHGTVAIHRRAGVHNFYAVNILDATLLVDMGGADKIEVLHVAADALAAYVLALDKVERVVGRCMREMRTL